MFFGSASLSLDSKGRLVIPTRYRDQLAEACQGQLTVTFDPTPCVLIYPRHEWEPMAEKLSKMPTLNPKVRALQFQLLGTASDVEMDAAGRILLPGNLRELAKLDKSVVLVGQGRRFELWDEARWKMTLEEAVPFNELPAELQDFSL